MERKNRICKDLKTLRSLEMGKKEQRKIDINKENTKKMSRRNNKTKRNQKGRV